MSALDEKLINYGGLAHFQDRLLDDSAKSEKSTWSSEKIDSELAAKQGVLTPSTNITIDASNNISADGYFYDETKGSFVTKYRQDAEDGGQIVANTATGLGSHAEGYGTTASGDYGSHAEGMETNASMDSAHAEGFRTTASGDYGAHAEGSWTSAIGNSSHAEGYGSQNYPIQALGRGSHAEGVGRIAQNEAEHAEGMFGVSHKSSNNFGDAGNTLHSIGNSYSRNNFHNAVEVMQNGDVYITGVGGYQGTDTKVQDATIKTLQGVITDINTSVAGKQDTLTAGSNISISSNTISADGYVWNASTGGFSEKYKQDSGDGGQIVGNTATGLGSHAEGYHNEATGDYGSHAEGCETVANGAASHAEGFDTEATGQSSHAEGQYTKATNYYAHAEGNKTNATGHGSHAEGFETTAQNQYEHAEGTSNYSHIVSDSYGNAGNTQLSVGIGGGFNTEADTRKNAFEIMQNGDMYVLGVGGYQGTDTHVQDATIKTLQGVITDINTSVAGKQDVLTPSTNITIDASNNISADGYFYDETKGSFVTKYRQDAEDGGALVLNVASGLSAVAEGYGTTASGDYGSHAEGNVTQATGIAAHAEGNHTTASGMVSHAEGTHTIASGKCAHAEGAENSATGSQSHAEGCYTTAQGYHCHAEGIGTIAQNFAEHSEGQYNVSHTNADADKYSYKGNTQHSIGIGANSGNRKNAFEIMQNGDMYVLGVGGYQGTDTHVQDATIKTLQEYITALETRITTLETQIANVASNSEINQMFNANAQA